MLDAGCGTGTLTALIAEAVGADGGVTGVDLSAQMIARARRKVADSHGVTLQRANIEQLPFTDGLFDKAFISFALHEMPPAARHNAISELYRVLQPGGSLLVLDYHLARGVAGFAVKTFVRFLEARSAYRMLLAQTLPQEIEQVGFSLEGRKLLIGGVFQMLRASKPAAEVEIG